MRRRTGRLKGAYDSNVDAMPEWSASGSLTGVTAGTIVTDPTMECCGFEIPLTGTPDNVTSVVGFVRPTGRKGNIKPTLEIWRSPGESAWYGMAIDLEPGQEFEYLITVEANESDVQNLVGTFTTRTENIETHAELLARATHFVDPVNGSDLAAGTSEQAAWRSIDYAWTNAPNNAVVCLLPGFHYRSLEYNTTSGQNGRTNTILLVAKYPACTKYGVIANEKLHTYIMPPKDHIIRKNIGAWSKVDLVGPGIAGAPADEVYPTWKYASGIADGSNRGIKHLHYTDSLGGRLHRVAHWKRDAIDLDTAESAIEKIHTNRSYHWGFWSDSSGNIYIRMYQDQDPNDFVWVIGENSISFTFQAADSRMCGLHIWGWPHGFTCRRSPSNKVICDLNWIEGPLFGMFQHANTTVDCPIDCVFQDNRITDLNLRDPDGIVSQDNNIIPWSLIKSQIKNADGTTYSTTKIAANCETTGFQGRGGGRRTVVRRNHFEGLNNGICPGQQSGYDKYSGYMFDQSENVMKNMCDDAEEPETQQINWASRDDYAERTLTLLSTGPVNYGPLYVVRYRGLRFGPSGLGIFAATDPITVGSVGFKYSGSSNPNCKIFVYNSSFWTDDVAHGGDEFASPGSNEDSFEFYNVIMRTGGYVFIAPLPAGKWVEDYCLLATGDTTKGMRVGASLYTTMAQYRTAKSQGLNSNIVNGQTQPIIDPSWLDDLLPNVTEGDFTLAEPVIGTRILGLSDRVSKPLIGYYRK